MTQLDTTEKYNLTGLWSIESSYFNQFERMSLPLGGFTIADCEELYLLLKSYYQEENLQQMNVVEIGSWTGLSTLVLNLIINKYKGKLYAVDWFMGSDNTNLDFAGKYINIRKVFDDNIKQFETKNLEVLSMTSEEAVKKFSNQSLDVVFIDGDHRYEYIRKDIELWLPKLKKNGLMCGHDCELILDNGLETLRDAFLEQDMIKKLHYGVCLAVTELGGKKVKSTPPHQYKESMESLIWYYKKP